MLFGLAWGWTQDLAGGLLTLGGLIVYVVLSWGLTGHLPPDAGYLALPLLAGAGFMVSGLLAKPRKSGSARE